MKQKLRDFLWNSSSQGTLLPSILTVRMKQRTISSNIRDNVIEESENGKQKIADYISKRLDRN